MDAGQTTNGSCPVRPVGAVSGCSAGGMTFSRERILDALPRLPFIDAGKLALVLGGDRPAPRDLPHTVWRWKEGRDRSSAERMTACSNPVEDLGLVHLFTE